ncbi:MAG: phosphate acetyltransferase [Kiritimatiellae bacterium]|nr:phosphate acetyltransferase [Kiritimatiellia bacterium]
MNLLKSLYPRAQAANRRIVLPEGHDPRVIAAAIKISQTKLATPVVLATPEERSAAETKAGDTLAAHHVEAFDYTKAPLLADLTAAFYEKRKAKGLTAEEAARILRTNRLYFGNMMLARGLVDGLVAGSIASTPDMLRAAFQCVGTAKGIKLASACFVMDLRAPTPAGDGTLIYADSGVNPCPTAEQLVDIAQATAGTCRALLGKQPRLAFLSFSTKGSASHELVDKMRLATELTRQRFKEIGLDAVVDGEMQADAALVPAVGASKNKGGAIQGDANVLIFPDLQAGNISYKLTERLAGAAAYGPILQGVARPVNDLSRGCNADDIVGVTAITICQGL